MGQRETGAPVAFFFFILISFTLVLDLHLFMLLDGIPNGSRLPYFRNSSTNPCTSISPFCTLSTKTMFLGWMDFYVHKPIATMLNRMFHLNRMMSADFVSALHVIAAIFSFKFLAHESLSVRRLGFAIYELGNMFDSLDGVIAKANQNHAQATTTTVKLETTTTTTTTTTAASTSGGGPNSMVGYLVDGICDGIGIIFLMSACVVYLQRHFRSSSKKSNLVPYTALTTVVTSPDSCGCDTSCVKCCGERKKDKVDDDDYNYNSEDEYCAEPSSLSSSSDLPFSSYHKQQFYYLFEKGLNVAKVMINSAMKYTLRTLRTIREGCAGGPGFPAVLCGFQMILASTFWNRSILFFVDVLEHPESVGLPAAVATESIHSPFMWLIFFCWRLFNPLAIAEYVLLAIFVDRVNGLLKLFQYSGFLIIGAVAAISEVYRVELISKAF